MARLLAALCAISLLGAAFAACGSEGPHSYTASSVTTSTAAVSSPVVARVGDSPITAARVAHWMMLLAPQHTVPQPPRFTACVRAARPRSSAATALTRCRDGYELLKRETLDYLISTAWLVEELNGRGLSIGRPELIGLLRERDAAAAGGASGFTADEALEGERELAVSKLTNLAREQTPAVTSAEQAVYYRRHLAQFTHPEKRTFDLVENIKTRLAADLQRAAFVAGRDSIESESFHEALARPANLNRVRTVTKAIFATAPGTISQPVKMAGYYFLLEVTRVEPPTTESLGEARGAIVRTLMQARERAAIAAFIAAWRRTWRARTTCLPAYVVQNCREYRGPRAPEAPLSFT